MTQPLALLLYESVYPGSHLVNRLEDRGYRVHSLTDSSRLVELASAHKPLVVIADVEPRYETVCAQLAKLRGHETTSHIPVIAVTGAQNEAAQAAAREAGASLVVADNAIVAHLDQFLQQALEV